MKRSLLTAALACVLVLLAVAAPALSVRPYRPDPVQFSMAAGGDEALLGSASRRGAGVVSKPLRAEKRFNALAFSWRGRSHEPRMAIRTRVEGGRWTPWAPLEAQAADSPDPGTEPAARSASAPSWVGEADWVQYRLDRRLPGLRLNFVNVRGSATAADRIRTAVRRIASTGTVALARTLAPGAAGAGASRPDMVSRSAWGASKCRPRSRPLEGEVRAAFVHHTVNPNGYTRAEAPDVVLAVCLFHRNSNGWDDIGYNFLVDRFGTIYEGRAGGVERAVVGAQAQGYNAQSTGIANLGTFVDEGQTPAALRAMARIIRWKLPLHGAPTSGQVTLTSTGGASNRYPAGRRVGLQRVNGHRDTGATTCPGEALYDQLPELRRLVGELPASGPRARVEAELEDGPQTVPAGRPVPITGTVTGPGGAPLAGAGLEVQALMGSTWRTLAPSVTAADGTFAASVSLRRTRTLRVRFPGAPGVPASNSPTLVVAVAPRIEVDPRPRAVAGAGRPAVLGGRISPRKRFVYQVLQLDRDGRFVTVAVKPLRVSRRGSFRGSFVPAAGGAYRVFIVAKADRATARGASRKYVVRVSRSRGGGVASP